MVFRKPYAFFIKNFRKIHIILLILCSIIYSKSIQVSAFNKEFMTYLSYDAYYEPISKYLNIWLYLIIILTVIGFIIVMVILKRKEKPWKLYLIPTIEYIYLLTIFIYITNFYNNYDGSFATTTIRALNNFLSIGLVPQFVVFLILIIRIIGLDIKNFNFSNDKEFLELNQDDREEFEVSINFDKYSLKRNIKKILRNIKYFYQEHKFICYIFIFIISFLIVFRIYYYFGITHKVIEEDKVFNVNNYSMQINDSFYTDKDKAGNIIEKNSAFIILNITVLNNGQSREFNGNDFQIVNSNKTYTFQGQTYSEDFSDLGNSFPTGKIKNGEKKNFALIFKVDKNLDYKKFVLYYQEYNRNTSFLRKIKLKLNNVMKIKENDKLNIGEELTINNFNDTSKFTFEKVEFGDSYNYNIESCNSDSSCSIITKNISPINQKIMYVEFSSLDYEGVDLLKFTTNYGKIIYVNDEGISKKIKPTSILVNQNYLGKYLYITVPNDIENSKSIEFIYTVRNNKYVYKIK